MQSTRNLRDILAAIDEAGRDGRYDDARELLHQKPPDELDRGLAAWEGAIYQEILERETPEVDVRAYALEWFAKRVASGAYLRGVPPEYAADFERDRRLGRKAVRAALDGLVTDGTLLCRYGKLWWPDDWAADVRKRRRVD